MNHRTHKLRITLTLSQAIEGYLFEKRVTFKPATLKNYGYVLDKLRAHFAGDPRLRDITARDIHALLDRYNTQLSGKSLLNIHAVCSSLWTWAVKEGYALENIVRQVPAPQPEKRAIIPYTEDDVRAMLEACRVTREYERPGKVACANSRPTALRDRALILLLLDSGVRASELCALRIEHLDKNNSRIKVFGKGSKERIIRIGRRTGKAIWRYLATRPDLLPTDPLFVADQTATRPLSRYSLHHLIKRIGRRAGITPDAHPHRFRHTFAITFLRNGGDVYSLQALLGHSTLEMVQRYLKLAQTDTENAHRRASPVDNWRL
jgi:integrase/recombinase XerD